MKGQNAKREKVLVAAILLSQLSLTVFPVWAQGDLSLEDSRTFNSEPIDITGQMKEEEVVDKELNDYQNELNNQKKQTTLFKKKAKVLNHIQKSTEKLSESAEEYVDERKEAEDMVAEYKKKMDCLLNENNKSAECAKYAHEKKEDQVTVAQAAVAPAPVAPQVVEAPTPKEDKAEQNKMKVLPYLGLNSYNNGQRVNFESEISTGLRVETLVHERVGVGLGFSYSQMNISQLNPFYSSQPYGGWYTNYYGAQGREINYRTYGIDIYSKFFLTVNSKLRPYIGAGLGYNRAQLKYNANSTQAYYGNIQYANEGYSASYASGQAMAGAEFNFSKNFGINLEAQYSRSLSSAMNQNAANFQGINYDQVYLQSLGNEIINSNVMTVNLGVVVSF